MIRLLKRAAVALVSFVRTPATLALLKWATKSGYAPAGSVEFFDPNTLRRHRGFKPRPIMVEADVAGARMRLDLADHIQYRAYMNGIFDPVPVAYALALCDSSTLYLDIGANVGTTAIPVAKRLIPTVCIEAATGVLSRLAANASLNTLGPFTVFQVAASDNAGQLELHIPLFGNAGAASVYRDWASSEAGRKTEVVRAVRIDSLVEVLGPARIGLIKVDVEGHELAVFRGMRDTVTRYRCAVVFEWRTDILKMNHLPIEDPKAYFPSDYVLNGIANRDGKLVLVPFDHLDMYENVMAAPPELQHLVRDVSTESLGIRG